MLRFADALSYGSMCAFAACLLLVMAFASPYWLVSWSDTESPFHNMGLWEFCFYKFRHPDYQFDHLFTGCHALYGDEYRLIREKLLPGWTSNRHPLTPIPTLHGSNFLGWLMVVQLFATLAIVFSFSGLIIIACLLLRYPLEIILRFEHHFCSVALICNALTGETANVRMRKQP